MTEKSATLNNYGFSPRIEPRPEYPSGLTMLFGACKEILYQSGFFGTILCLLLYPSYLQLCGFLRALLDSYGYGSEEMVFNILLSLTHTLAYVVICGSFGLFDYFQLFQQYKLARKPHMAAKSGLLVKTLVEASINQLIVGPLVGYFLYRLGRRCGMSVMQSALPTPAEMFVSFCIASVFNGVGFYWAHRIFHSKSLYATFHKQHHEYSGSIGISAEYANPLEQLLANQLPSIGGAIIFGKHPLVVLVWIFLRLQETYEAHSGYCFKDTIFDYLGLAHADDAAHHDYHHSVNQGNFGIIYMDWLFGTMDGYCAGGHRDGYIARKQAQNQAKTK